MYAFRCLVFVGQTKPPVDVVQIWRRFGIDYQRCLSLDPKGPRTDPCQQVRFFFFFGWGLVTTKRQPSGVQSGAGCLLGYILFHSHEHYCTVFGYLLRWCSIVLFFISLMKQQPDNVQASVQDLYDGGTTLSGLRVLSGSYCTCPPPPPPRLLFFPVFSVLSPFLRVFFSITPSLLYASIILIFVLMRVL